MHLGFTAQSDMLKLILEIASPNLIAHSYIYLLMI